MVAAWLNLEALEAESADIFILAQMMAAIAGLKKTGWLDDQWAFFADGVWVVTDTVNAFSRSTYLYRIANSISGSWHA